MANRLDALQSSLVTIAPPQQSQQPQQQSQQPPDTRSAQQQTAGALWNNSNPPLPRGRAPRDPNARISKFQVKSIEELEIMLRSFLDNPPATPEHSTCEITLLSYATLKHSEFESENEDPDLANHGSSLAYMDCPNTVIEALTAGPDPKENMKKQRTVSKVCVAAIQRVDGYRYSFHNNWKSGEENAYRFSYYCNDSLLNKDRVANGKAGSQGRRATKPVYDCKGVLSIKFSATRKVIEVIYKHIPCHPTYEERAPTPRRNSKRRASWERTHPDRITQPIESTPEKPKSRPAKRNRPIESGPKPASLESELREQSMASLLELIVTDTSLASKQSQASPASQERPNTSASWQQQSSLPHQLAHQQQQLPPQSQQYQQQQQHHQQQQQQAVPHQVICAVCLHRRARCDGTKPKCGPCARQNWPCWYKKEDAPKVQPAGRDSLVLPISPQTPTKDNTKQLDKLRKDRDQAHQALKDAQDEIEILKRRVQAQEDAMKRLEEEKAAASVTSQAAFTIPTPTTRIPSTFQAHDNRTMNPNQAFPAGLTTHAPRGQLYANANQIVPQVPRWPPNPQFLGYPPTTDNPLWNPGGMPSQLR